MAATDTQSPGFRDEYQAPEPSTIPKTMRGWQRQHRGHYSSSLELVDSLPVPANPGPDSSDIIIRVSYVALEWIIPYILSFFPALPLVPAVIPEFSVSGTVALAGGRAPAELSQAGTKILATVSPMSTLVSGTGALKEYMRVSASDVVPFSRHNGTPQDQFPTMAEGAGLIANGSAALAVVRAANVAEGERVLVNGASGGVGHIVAQVCRARGAHVVGVASGANEDFVREHGCHEFVDYRKHANLPEYLASNFASQPFDSILDCIGTQDLYTNSPRYLREGRPFVNIGTFAVTEAPLSFTWGFLKNRFCPTWLGGVPRPYIFFSNMPKLEDALTLVEMMKQQKMKINIDSEYAMEDLIEAYDRATSKRARGKVIIRVH